MTHGTLIWHRCFCSYCSPSPSPSLKHDTSFSLYIFFLSFFLPPKRSIPRSFPSPFLRRILSNLSLAASPSPLLIGTRMKKGARSVPPLSPCFDARGGSRARREIITRRKGTHIPMLRAVECILTRCTRIRCDGGWLWEFRDDLASWMNVVEFTSFPPDIIYSFPTFRIFLLLASGFFIYFCAGKIGGEKRRDGKVPLSREGSRRLELNSFRSVVTIKWRDVQWYANNGGKERGS